MAEDGSGLHQFWSTQPVIQPGSARTERVGPVDAVKTVDDIPAEPIAIASTLEWWTPDMSNEDDIRTVYELLRDNYVEDNESMFRFKYSVDFLRWAMTPPGYHPEWHIGVVRKRDKMLLGFVSGIPITMRMGTPKKMSGGGENEKEVEQNSNGDNNKEVENAYLEARYICEINFLCVHKLLRTKRLAPILIREVTRRVNRMNIWQAVYTAGRMLPTPFSCARYHHRNLDPEKLVSVGFSGMPQHFEKFQNPMSMLKRFYKLPDKTATRGLRPMEPRDVPQVAKLLNKKLSTYDVAPIFTEEEVAHYLLPRENVLLSYVVDQVDNCHSGHADGVSNNKHGGQKQKHDGTSGQGGNASSSSGGGGGGGNKKNTNNNANNNNNNNNNTASCITDFFSFFSLPSTIIGNSKYSVLNAAYVYYNAANSVTITQLMSDLLILARQKGFDVCNLVGIQDNEEFLKELKFGVGDGSLYYYFYNWYYPNLEPSRVGLYML